MATQEQSELLTHTGPDTPMGNLMRQYWIPILLSEELPEPDCPPVRVRLLSERLIAFRDTEGKLGLIDEFCAHRGVSLWFGRNEEGGIRCPYHGWKYNTKGECVEVPSEPDESGFCSRIRLTAYSLEEKGGVIWAYMGPPEEKPELRASSGCPFLRKTSTFPNVGSSATTFRPWRGGSTRPMSPSCIPESCKRHLRPTFF